MLGWIDWKPQGLPLIRKRVELLCGEYDDIIVKGEKDA